MKFFRNQLCCAIIALPLAGVVPAEAAGPPLDWMAGHWCQEQDGTTYEELWLPPVGGVLVGLGRTRTSDRTTGFEYLRIIDRDGEQSYIAQPGGRPPTSFKRTGGGEDSVRFENPEHDFPQRIEYRRQGDKLIGEVSGPGKNGEITALTFDYLACDSQVRGNKKP